MGFPAYTTNAPAAVDLSARWTWTGSIPAHTNLAADTNAAPAANALPANTNTGPGALGLPANTGAAPAATDLPYPNTTPAGTGVIDTTPLPLPPDISMKPAFTGITAGTSRLKLKNASAVNIDELIQGKDDSGNWIRFLVAAGTTAEQLDPAAGPLVVHPANYNAVTNAIILLQQA